MLKKLHVSRSRVPASILSFGLLLCQARVSLAQGQAAKAPAVTAPVAAPAAVVVEPSTVTTDAIHAAAEAAKAAAEAAQSTAQAVHDLAGHVEDLEHVEPTSAPALPVWSYQLGLNSLAKTGNASNFSGQATLGVDGHWHMWATEMRLRGAYGASNPVSDSDGVPDRQTTTFNGAASLRGERHFTPFLGNYILVSAATDRVASIQLQGSGELGLTLVWWEIERDGYVKSRLRTSIGLRYMREIRRQFYPERADISMDRNIWGPPITVNYRYALTRNIYFTEDFDVLYDVNSSKDVRINSQTVLAAGITDHVGLQIGFNVRYIGQPAENRRSTDTELTAGLNFSF